MLDKLRPLFPYLRRYRRDFFWGGLVVVLSNAFKIAIPLVIGRSISGLNHGFTLSAALHLALLLVGLSAASGVFLFLTRWIMIGISREIEFDLRNDLFEHLEKQSTAFYQEHRTGDIMARMTNDLNAVRQLLGPAIMYSANTVIFSVGAVFFLLRISPFLTLVALAPLPLASILVQSFGRRIHDRFERIQAMYSEISAQAQENFSGARLVRAFAQEEAQIAAFEKSNQENIRRGLRLVQLMGMLWPTLEFILGFAMVVSLLVGGHEVLSHRISVGDFVAFNTYMVMLTWPIIALGWVVNLVQRGTASVVRIDELLKEQPSIHDAQASASIPPDLRLRGDISIRNLNFSYRDTSGQMVEALHHISLEIPAGSSLAIVGPTGSGKSTLVSLLPRIFDVDQDTGQDLGQDLGQDIGQDIGHDELTQPSQRRNGHPSSSNGSASPESSHPASSSTQQLTGSILIDGLPIRAYPLEVLRTNIAFVPQETFLFSESIRENIAFGAPDASPEAILVAAEAAHIRTEFEEFPHGFDTMVGERGLTLSGGQKQRAAIARALVCDPAILILDDALASVDTYTEERILQHLRGVMRGRTTIFISHRISTVRHADRIAVLDRGSIAEYGTHEELIERDGFYARLFQKQQLEEELSVAS